jgi:hypothetical protein
MAAMLGTRWAGMATGFMAIKAHCECAGRLRAATAACARDVDGLLALRARLKNLVGEGADLLMPEAAIGSSLVKPTVGHARHWGGVDHPCGAVRLRSTDHR